MPSRKQIRERELAFSALSLMRREKLSLREAAKKRDIPKGVVLRYVSDALRKIGSNYYAKPTDSISRPLKVVTEQGIVFDVFNSRDATLISKHMTGIKDYVDTGNPKFLDPFKRKKVGPYRLASDPATIETLAGAGELDFKTIYNFMGVRR